MALSRIGTPAAIEATTITIPSGHQIGDLLIIYAFRSAITAPSLPAGWTNLINVSGGASSYRCGWKLAVSSADVSGTWTNATGLEVIVYRGVATNKTPLQAVGSNTATGTSVTYNSNQNAMKCPGTSWLAAFAATKTTDSALETPPTGMTNEANLVGAAAEYAIHDTNGIYTGTGAWPVINVAVGGTSAEWRSLVVEIFAEQLAPLNDYQFVKVGDGMSASEKIR